MLILPALARRQPERDEEADPRSGVAQQLGAGLRRRRSTSRPRYNPWDQRLCLVPDGDLFDAISAGTAVGRHRPDRDLHRDGHPAEVRRGARGRPHRHRDRARICKLVGGMQLAVDGEAVELAQDA